MNMKKIYEVEFKPTKYSGESNMTLHVRARSVLEAVKLGEKLAKNIIGDDDKPWKSACIRCEFYADIDN